MLQESYNELLPMYNITRSMSRAGTPTDNAAMEAINGWVKAELFTDLHITSADDVPGQVTEYIRFFNEERPHTPLDTLLQSSIGNGSRPSAEEPTLDKRSLRIDSVDIQTSIKFSVFNGYLTL